LIGASGSGKTTLADIAAGLLCPDAGRVLVDGAPLGDAAPAWRSRIGYVGQETFLIHDTIRANLLWARPDASEAQLRESLRRADAHRFVDALPGGLETVVGDRGACLSGGERQRLALARALLREPALLVLDEATSSLDGASERRVMQAVRALRGRLAILVVTHRLSLLRAGDLVHVLERGGVVESGRCDALLAANGRLAALLRAHLVDLDDAAVAAPLAGADRPSYLPDLASSAG
jgi:ATP-binding cassette, subfamily C, bacterial